MGQGQRPTSGRAPRLGPDESIAGYFTRVGRFRKIDPTKGRPLPAVSRWVGTFGWAVLVVETLRRARRQAGPAEAGEGAAARR